MKIEEKFCTSISTTVIAASSTQRQQSRLHTVDVSNAAFTDKYIAESNKLNQTYAHELSYYNLLRDPAATNGFNPFDRHLSSLYRAVAHGGGRIKAL